MPHPETWLKVTKAPVPPLTLALYQVLRPTSLADGQSVDGVDARRERVVAGSRGIHALVCRTLVCRTVTGHVDHLT